MSTTGETKQGDNLAHEDAIRATVRGLAKDLGTKVAFVCELADDREHARTLALSVDGDFLENLEYRVAGTPCAQVYEEGLLFHPKDLAKIYPEDRMLTQWRLESYLGVGFYDTEGKLMGHLGVMHDGTMENASHTETRLRSAALEVGAELERRRGKG